MTNLNVTRSLAFNTVYRFLEMEGGLVPGDVISIKLGDIIPADARLLEVDLLKIDQSDLLSLVSLCQLQKIQVMKDSLGLPASMVRLKVDCHWGAFLVKLLIL